MSSPRILIAGIGNIFMGDDAFGVEVAQRLARQTWPAGVVVKDFGIRALDTAYALLDEPEVVILVDAVPRGEPPGTVYVIEIDPAEIDGPSSSGLVLDAHTMNPVAVLQMVKSLGGSFGKVLLVGCEPAELGILEEGAMGLSEPVAAAVPRACEVVESLVARNIGQQPATAEIPGSVSNGWEVLE